MASTTFNSLYVIPASHDPASPRRTALTDAGYEVIEQLSREGNGWESIAKHLGISPITLRHMRKEDPAINDAFLLGKGQLDTEITTLLLKQARDNNISAQIFLAKTKLGWREVGPSPDMPQTAIQTNIYVTAPMTDEQFRQLTHGPTNPPEEES